MTQLRQSLSDLSHVFGSASMNPFTRFIMAQKGALPRGVNDRMIAMSNALMYISFDVHAL